MNEFDLFAIGVYTFKQGYFVGILFWLMTLLVVYQIVLFIKYQITKNYTRGLM